MNAKARQEKLRTIVADAGYDALEDLLEAVAVDSVSPAICVNPGCSYTTDMEPDQEAGYCEACDTNTVKSALVLAGVI